MPMPKPKKGEEKKDFLGRCMGNDIMVKEYEDGDQRFAVCQSLWDKDKASAAPEMEYRKFAGDWEYRKEGNDLILVGYAAVFEQLSIDLGGFQEKVRKGAFAKTLTDFNQKFQANHEGLALASTAKGSLILMEDDKGLHVEVRLPLASPDVQSLYYAIQNGGIDQMSFCFNVIRDEWEKLDTPMPIRTLVEVMLAEVSAVNDAAYTQTSIAIARSMLRQAARAMWNGKREVANKVELASNMLEDAVLFGAIDVKPEPPTEVEKVSIMERVRCRLQVAGK